MTPNFKVFPRTNYKSLGKTTLKNGTAEYRSSNYVFYESVRSPWKVDMKIANYNKVAD